MKISYNWLKELVPGIPAPEAVAELLTFHTVEVEAVERIGDDWALSLDVLPNRAHDLNSHLGVAREVSLLTGKKLCMPKATVREGKAKAAATLAVRLEDTKACPRYIGRYVSGVSVGPSPAWLVARLEACGMRGINTVVDATNYVMLETGQPLHAFDASLVAKNPKSGKHEIVVRRAAKGERFVTLDDQSFVLTGTELLIADAEKALALAGIKGGKNPGISAATTAVILEAANFDGGLVRATSRRLGLFTDSAKQFSGGLAPELTQAAMARLTSLVQELAGGVVYAGAADAYPKKRTQKAIAFSPDAARALMGSPMPDARMALLLASLGCRVKKNTKRAWAVTPPSERLDLATAEELVEEVGRLAGWEKVVPVAPVVAASPVAENSAHRDGQKCRGALVGMGFSEHVGRTLWGEKLLGAFAEPGAVFPMLANPLTEDAVYLRPTLAPSIGVAVATNARFHDAVRIFEIGKTFSATANGGVEECWRIGIALSLAREERAGAAWYALKGVLEALVNVQGSRAKCTPSARTAVSASLTPESAHGISAGDTTLGVFGYLTDAARAALGIDGVVAFAELDLALFGALACRTAEYAEIPKYPAVMRDLAVVVPATMRAGDVQAVIRDTAGPLLASLELFDVYEGKGVPTGKASMAFHLAFQSPERTLTDDEAGAAFANILAAIQTKGWEVR